MKKILLSVFILFTLNSGLKAQIFLDIINLSFNVISTADEGGYEGGFTLYNNSPAVSHSLKAAWHFGERFHFGTNIRYGNNVIQSLTKTQRFKFVNLESNIYFEYIHPSPKKYFISVPVSFGAGSFYIPPHYVPANENYVTGFFSFEPRVQFNQPMLDWLMFTASGGYRFVSSGPLYGTNSMNLGGPTLNFALVFGNFK